MPVLQPPLYCVTLSPGGATIKHELKLLFPPLMEILHEHPEGISEYNLLVRLKERGIEPFAAGDTKTPSAPELELFQSHFFLFHTLYTLSDQLRNQNLGELSIFCLEIRLVLRSGIENSGENPGQMMERDPLREYYLDWKNFEDTDEQTVRRMLDETGKKIRAYWSADQAYKALGLPPDSKFSLVQKRYRELCREHHPDSGGNPGQFMQIQNAMEIIRNLQI